MEHQIFMLLHRTRSSNQYLNTSDEQEEAIEREEVESESELMEKAKQLLELTKEETDAVQKLPVHPKKPGQSCFYTFFALRGIQVDRVEPGLVVCTLKVPPRLTVRFRKLSLTSFSPTSDLIPMNTSRKSIDDLFISERG